METTVNRTSYQAPQTASVRIRHGARRAVLSGLKLVVLLAVAGSLGAAPLYPVKVGPTGRLVDQTGAPVLVAGKSAQGMIGNINSTTTTASPQLSRAAIRLVQSASIAQDTTSTSLSLAFPDDVSNGNLIFVAISWGWAPGVPGSATVADSAGNTYHLIDQADDSESHNTLQTWYAYNIAGGGTKPTVTVRFSDEGPDRCGVHGQYFLLLAIHEFTGVLASSDPLDTHGTNAVRQDTYSSRPDGVVAPASPLTPSEDGELIVGALVSVQACGTIAPGSTFTEMVHQGIRLFCGTNNPLQTQYATQRSAAPIHSTWTETFVSESPPDRACPTTPPDSPNSVVALLLAAATFKADTTASSGGLIAAVLPASRSVQVGVPATAFATIINTDSAAGIQCGIAPATDLPVTFSFQTADQVTNQVTGAPNARVDIPAGASQSFAFAFTPLAPIAPSDVALVFSCANKSSAPSFSGLNTLLLSASAGPVPDIVALAATVGNTGSVDIPGPTGAAAFALATVNLGAAATITASADIGDAGAPVTLMLCETTPVTGACRGPLGQAVTSTIDAGATPTFAVFVQASGTVMFQPATTRIFVRFADAQGTTRGATSVAVRTQ